MPPITVRDALRLALPPGTAVLAGANGLGHQVSWVATQRATPPVFANLRGGELALVSVAAAQAIDNRLTLATLIDRLSHVPIAAIAVLGAVPPEAAAVADTTHIPILQVPNGANLGEIEREMQRLFGDYEAQLERRAAQFSQLLTQRSLAGAGLAGLMELVAERTGQSVGVYNVIGEPRSLRGRGSARVALQTLRPHAVGPMTHLGQSIWVQPLVAAEARLGYLALAGSSLDEWDRTAAEQAAIALALEMAKEQAVLAAEERLRGDFVQSVLMGPPGDQEALLQRAQELGYDLRHPHVALLCAVPGDETQAARAATALTNALNGLRLAAPAMRRADGAICFVPLADRSTRIGDIAEQLAKRVRADMPLAMLAFGKEAASVALWPRSLREAEQALLLGRQLFSRAHIFDFSDLGVYRLLVLLRESPELWDFYRTTLATLANYDEKQDAELLKTLEAFFAGLGNLARTAEILHVHRNTLLYRLKRIEEISGLNLDDAEDRLAIWLALKAHRVLQTLDAPWGEE